MQAIPLTSQLFSADQQWDFTVTSWDTPFTVLEGGVASGGIIFDLVEPKDTAATTWKAFTDAFKSVAQNTSAVASFTGNANIVQQVSNGRLDNLVGYWAAGAPGQHGATVPGRVAYHFRGYLRSVTGRGWFSATSVPTWFLALAGNGYFRIDMTVSATVTTLFSGNVTEKDYLVNGFSFTPTISTMAAGDFVDIYYIQTGAENWGGFTIKPVAAARSTDAVDQAAAQTAHILGCGLLDDNTPPAVQVFHSIKSVEVGADQGKPMSADLELPLLNTAVHDGTGWKWSESTPDDPGFMQLYEGGVVTVTLKRKRLIQVIGGFAGEQYTLFTGLVQDFSEPTGNFSTLNALGMEIRLLEQHDKNYPDPISYMTRGYKRTTSATGTSEPIYPIPAYDNWPMEHSVADLMLRNGIDASRLTRQLTVPKSDGTTASPAGFLKFRAKTLGGKLLRMERAVHYGNANIGFDESLPADDPYIFKPEVTKEVWNRSREMVERLGYELRFDEFGDAILKGRNNPSTVYDIVSGDATGSPTNGTNPSAYAAKYLQWTGTAGAFTKALTAARIDITMPLGPTLGSWLYTVDSAPVSGLIANWSFDDNLGTDASGNGNTGALSNSPTFVNGAVGRAILLNGSNQSVFVSAMPIGPTAGITFRAIINGTTFATTVHTLFSWDNQATTGFHWLYVDIGGTLTYQFADATAARNTPSSGGALTAGVQYDIAVTHDFAAKTLTFYVNGAVYSTHSLAAFGAPVPVTVGKSLRIGAYVGSLHFFAGTIDEARIYGRVLSTPEVAGLATSIVASGTLICSGALADTYFFDGALAADASNATVATLYSGNYGTYTVTLVASGASATRRADCFLLYNVDPMKPMFPQTLSTARNALKVQASSAMDDMRNSVIVVGRRKATVTDSDKFANNPNNPEGEFIVERLVDKASVTNPAATNFIGTVKESIIYDSSISDNAYARYLARVFIYRYRNPRPSAKVEHTLVPQLQQRDPIYAEETRYGTVSVDQVDARKSVLWVTGYKHRIEGKRAISSLTTQSFPDFPAFEPREDIDLSAFNGKPIINLSVSYVSLTGELKTNLTSSSVYQCVEALTSTSGGTTAGGDWVFVGSVPVVNNTLTIPSNVLLNGWPPLPGTVFIEPSLTSPTTTSATRRTPDTGTVKLSRGGTLPSVKLPYFAGVTSVLLNQSVVGISGYNKTAGTSRTGQYWYEVNDDDVMTVGAGSQAPIPQLDAFAQITWLQAQKDAKMGSVTNNPYHHFFNVDYRDTNRVITLVWNQGDNANAMYTRSANASTFAIRYRRLGPVAATGIFDNTLLPSAYASGGSPFFDPYTSELGYTVNIKGDFLVSGLYRVSVRNLDDNTVVAWLTEPLADNTKPESHWQYFTAGAGRQFAWDGVDNVGTWNQKQSTAYAAAASGAFEQTQRVIGAGFYAWNRELEDNKPGPLALIAGSRDTNGKPVFGHGTFSRWYIYIEAKTDTVNTVVRTDALDSANNGGATAALVFTHLPEPTKAELAIADWSSGTAFDVADLNSASAASALNPANWSTTPDADGVINNQKPVRIRFKVQQRPGTLWSGVNGEATVKLARVAHMRVNLMDQFVVYNGTNWPNSSYEDRAIYNRRLTNDEHTIKYEDDNYRKASSLKWLDADPGTEWVFTPSLFKKNFRGFDEAVVFGDYLQLEEVPKWDEGQRNKIAGTRARMQIAFMNYLWYLSAYVSDRSGRSVWAWNRSFLDKSKIINNAITEWPDYALPAGTNSATFSYNLADASWSFVGAGSRTLNAVGLDGTPNTATTLVDSDAVNFTSVSKGVSVGVDTNTHAVAVWILKDTNQTRFPQVKVTISGGTSVVRGVTLNTQTSATGVNNAAGTTAHQVSDWGLWWKLEITVTNNATAGNTNLAVTVYPATSTTIGVDSAAATGTTIFGQVQIQVNQASTTGPIFTTSTAVTTPVLPNSTLFSYRVDSPDDPMQQHRRTVVTRQWADEKINGTDWRTGQRTRWGISAGEIGDQLLRHKWQDHHPLSTTINGVAWSSFVNLTSDQYSLWHAIAGRQPGTFANPAIATTYTNSRQLATLGAACIWTWEVSPSWIPCITRDFHGYYLLPPMMDRDALRGSNFAPQGGLYECVDLRPYVNTLNKNEGADPAAGETWSSPIYDMTTTYDPSTSGFVRFWPGHKVSTSEEPTKSHGVLVTTVDYVRQDELVHWEDLRGAFSRGKRPAEQPIKVTPVQSYYQNAFRYGTIMGDTAYQNGTYPLFRVTIQNWFRMSFRSEYFWESGSMFPTSLYGLEKLAWMNASKARFNSPASSSTIKYDTGAWVGWKDDRQGGGNDSLSGNKVGFIDWDLVQGVTGKGRILTPFETDAQVMGIGPELPTTKDMIFHMVLVTERRSVPV